MINDLVCLAVAIGCEDKLIVHNIIMEQISERAHKRRPRMRQPGTFRKLRFCDKAHSTPKIVCVCVCVYTFSVLFTHPSTRTLLYAVRAVRRVDGQKIVTKLLENIVSWHAGFALRPTES